MIKKSDTGSGNWKTAAHSNSYTTTAEDIGWYFRSNSYASDESDPPAGVSNFSNTVGPILPPPPLEVEAPVLTGHPCIGYELTCSQPETTGGTGQYSYQYSWDDMARNAAPLMPQTQKLVAADLGKSLVCTVQVSDADPLVDNVQVQSAATEPVFRPTMPEFKGYANGEEASLLPTEQIKVVPNGEAVLEVRISGQPEGLEPKDLHYTWTLNGLGRLSGTSGASIIYLAPEEQERFTYPHVVCEIRSIHAGTEPVKVHFWLRQAYIQLYNDSSKDYIQTNNVDWVGSTIHCWRASPMGGSVTEREYWDDDFDEDEHYFYSFLWSNGHTENELPLTEDMWGTTIKCTVTITDPTYEGIKPFVIETLDFLVKKEVIPDEWVLKQDMDPFVDDWQDPPTDPPSQRSGYSMKLAYHPVLPEGAWRLPNDFKYKWTHEGYGHIVGTDNRYYCSVQTPTPSYGQVVEEMAYITVTHTSLSFDHEKTMPTIPIRYYAP